MLGSRRSGSRAPFVRSIVTTLCGRHLVDGAMVVPWCEGPWFSPVCPGLLLGMVIASLLTGDMENVTVVMSTYVSVDTGFATGSMSALGVLYPSSLCFKGISVDCSVECGSLELVPVPVS